MFVSYSPYMTFGAKWLRKSRKINNPDASVGAQCSMFRTVCSIRWLQSALIPFCYDAERRGIKPHE